MMIPKRPYGSRLVATVVMTTATMTFWWAASMSIASAAGPGADQSQPAACGGDAALRAFFKGAPGGMKVKDKVELYDEKGLFNYIDGGAPLYIKHHFRRLAGVEVALENGGELTCDIYDMNGPANALAVFSEEKSSTFKPVPKWSEAASGPLSFIFHQGCYYVKLTAFDKKAESALPAIANALRERMGGATAAPARK
jgi:hypothetical protein